MKTISMIATTLISVSSMASVLLETPRLISGDGMSRVTAVEESCEPDFSTRDIKYKCADAGKETYNAHMVALTGKAAETLWKVLKDAPHFPDQQDYDKMKYLEGSLEQYEKIKGHDVSCYKEVQSDKNGKIKKSAEGKALRQYSCILSVDSKGNTNAESN